MGRIKLTRSRVTVLTVFVWALALSSGSLARAAGDMNQRFCSGNETLTGFHRPSRTVGKSAKWQWRPMD